MNIINTKDFSYSHFIDVLKPLSILDGHINSDNFAGSGEFYQKKYINQCMN